MASNKYHAIILLIVVVALNASVCCKAKAFLLSGEILHSGESLQHGDSVLTMQPNCNLVLSQGTKTIWSSNSRATGPCSLTMQYDRNVVIHGPGGVVWAANTWSGGHGYYILAVEESGRLTLFGNLVWGTPVRNIINTNETGSIINMVTSTGV